MWDSDSNKRNKYIYFMKKVKQGKEMIVWRILYYIGWVVKDFLKAGHLNK